MGRCAAKSQKTQFRVVGDARAWVPRAKASVAVGTLVSLVVLAAVEQGVPVSTAVGANSPVDTGMDPDNREDRRSSVADSLQGSSKRAGHAAQVGGNQNRSIGH